jgi:hypothetical protein
MNRSYRRLLGLFVIATAVGVGVAHSQTRAATRVVDYICNTKAVCLGLTQADAAECGTNGSCRGNYQVGSFATCTNQTSSFCTYDSSQYGSTTCPGYCVGTINTPCSVVAAGCRP